MKERVYLDYNATPPLAPEVVDAIVGLEAACKLAQAWIDDESVTTQRDAFWHALRDRFGDRIVLNGHPERRLPNTLSVGFRGEIGGKLVARMPEVAASTGSACHAGSLQMSPVLAAMNVPEGVALGTIRFSLGRETRRDEWEFVVERLASLIGYVEQTDSNPYLRANSKL